MKTPTSNLNTKLSSDIARFQTNARTLQLACALMDEVPCLTYAPFIYMEGHFFILLNRSQHSAEVLEQKRKAAVMIIEDESRSRRLLARRHLRYSVSTTHVPEHSLYWKAAMAQLNKQFGGYKAQEDHSEQTLFCLTPYEGTYSQSNGEQVHLDDEALAQIFAISDNSNPGLFPTLSFGF